MDADSQRLKIRMHILQMSQSCQFIRPYIRIHGHDRISHTSRLIVGMILYIQTLCYICTCVGSSPSLVRIDRIHRRKSSNNLPTKLFRLLPEEQSLGRGAVGGGGDDKEHDKNHDDQQHVTSYSQRHPNYYYTNGNRVSGNTKSAYSYYDYNDDDSYYSRHNINGQRNKLYSYTTKLSDVYWCLLIALGWTIWMIHSIASLRQQHYVTMLSISERGLNDTSMMLTPSADTMRIFRTNFSSLLLVRGHVLDIISKPVIATDAPIVRAPTCTVVIDYVVERQLQPLLSPTTTTAGINHDDVVTTLPTMDSETAPPNEFIQIRKHFERHMRTWK
jgi:hypothetical protein